MLEIFSSLGSISAFNVIMSEYLITALKVDGKLMKQIVTWSSSMLLSLIGFIFGFGMFADYGTITSASGWIYTVITGVGLGLISNGIYEIDIIKNFIKGVKETSFNINK